MDTKIDYDQLQYDVSLLLGICGRGSEYDNPLWVKVLNLRYGEENVRKMIEFLLKEKTNDE